MGDRWGPLQTPSLSNERYSHGYPMRGQEGGGQGVFEHDLRLFPNIGPPGAEVWARINTRTHTQTHQDKDRTASAGTDAVDRETEEKWVGFLNALSGLFCSSLNRMEASSTSAHPAATSPFAHPHTAASRASPLHTAPLHTSRATDGRPPTHTHTHTRYGFLPRESMCSENIQPWLQLLPTRDQVSLWMRRRICTDTQTNNQTHIQTYKHTKSLTYIRTYIHHPHVYA